MREKKIIQEYQEFCDRWREEGVSFVSTLAFPSSVLLEDEWNGASDLNICLAYNRVEHETILRSLYVNLEMAEAELGISLADAMYDTYEHLNEKKGAEEYEC